MATDASFVEYVQEQTGLGTRLRAKKMFGEYALYVDERVVAFACDNQLFLKPTAQGRALLTQVDEAPPYPGAKLHLRIDDEIDNGASLQRLLLATAHALPPPKPKPKRPSKTKTTAGSKQQTG